VLLYRGASAVAYAHYSVQAGAGKRCAERSAQRSYRRRRGAGALATVRVRLRHWAATLARSNRSPADRRHRFIARCSRQPELPFAETGIDAALGEQLLVRTDLDDASLVHDDDAIGMQDGGQPMRDHEAGASLHQALQRILNQVFAFT